MDTALHHPLRDGNRLQRAYYRWAVPYYERLAPELRGHVEALDIALYTRQGLGTWLGALGAWAGATVGLMAAGLSLAAAAAVAALYAVSASFSMLQAWLLPEAFLAKRMALKGLAWLAFGLLAGMAGVGVGQALRNGAFEWEAYRRLFDATKLGVVLGLALICASQILAMWAVAKARRSELERERAQAQLVAERDAAAHAATEARLRLLQGQIQPHFIFNTLATLQHWVDKGDARAAGLLRELTAFLRSSTELLGQASVSLGEEVQAVRHYLSILQARLGERLVVAIDIEPALVPQPLPPGLLLTLVENAVAHGIEPKIGGGRVRVSAALTPVGWRLGVEDDGVGLAGEGGAGVGLANLRQRLQHHFAGNARFSLQPRAEGGTRACIDVEVP
ncbi:MAG: histidine kinase [Burkholderiales bacterium]|nr:histidine kinase [Burkholderiales bacterium]